jgi:hypothetical protein
MIPAVWYNQSHHPCCLVQPITWSLLYDTSNHMIPAVWYNQSYDPCCMIQPITWSLLYYKRNKRNKGVKKGMSIYRYKLFIVHLIYEDILMHSLRKSLSETCTTLLCSYWWYHTVGIIWLVVSYSRDHVIGCIIQQGSYDWLYHTAGIMWLDVSYSRDHVIGCIIQQGWCDWLYHTAGIMWLVVWYSSASITWSLLYDTTNHMIPAVWYN